MGFPVLLWSGLPELLETAVTKNVLFVRIVENMPLWLGLNHCDVSNYLCLRVDILTISNSAFSNSEIYSKSKLCFPELS